MIFFSAFRKLWSSSPWVKIKDQVCFYWLDLSDWCLRWAQGKEPGAPPGTLTTSINIQWYILCVLQGSGDAPGKRSRKERTFPGQSQQSGSETRGGDVSAAALQTSHIWGGIKPAAPQAHWSEDNHVGKLDFGKNLCCKYLNIKCP